MTDHNSSLLLPWFAKGLQLISKLRGSRIPLLRVFGQGFEADGFQTKRNFNRCRKRRFIGPG